MTNLKQAVNHPIFDKISNYCQENNKECFVVGGYVMLKPFLGIVSRNYKVNTP